MSKSNPASLTVGTSSNYSFTLNNTGQLASGSSIVVYDQLPANVAYTGAAPASGGSVTPNSVGCVVQSGSVASGQLLKCTMGLPSGLSAPSGSARFTVAVTPQSGVASSVSNKAMVDPSGANAAQNPSSCTSTNSPAGCAVTSALSVGSGVNLGLSKSNPPSLTVGVSSAYTLSLSNTGSGASATTLNVYEQLPADLAYNSAAAASTGTVTPTGVSCSVVSGTVATGQLLNCAVSLPTGGLPAGTGTADFALNVTPQPGVASSVGNKAQIDPTGGNAAQTPSACTANNSPAGCAVTASQSVGNGVNLGLSKTNPTSLTVGVAGNYTLSLSNTGTGPSGTSIDVYDQLPAGVSFNSAAPASGGTVTASAASCTVQSGDVTTGQLLKCTLTLPAGGIPASNGSTSFTVNVTPTATASGQSVSNKAQIDTTGGNAAQTPANCTANNSPAGCAVTASQSVAAGVSLTLTKNNPSSLAIGAGSNYSFRISNNGGGASATTLNVYEQLPAYLAYNSAAAASTGTVTPTGVSCSVVSGTVATGQLLNCAVSLPTGGLPAGTGTADFALNVTPQPGVASSVGNKAQIDPTGANAAQTPSACTANNSPAGCAVTAAQSVGNGVNLALNKTNPASLTVGVASAYTLSLSNTGSGASGTSIDVYEQLPAGIGFSSAASASGGSVTPSGVSCTVQSGDVTSGQLLKCTLTLPAGGIPASTGTANFTVSVTPTAAASGQSVSNKAAVDSSGGNAVQTPASCTGSNTPTAGCAVSPAQTVGSGITLALSKISTGGVGSFTFSGTNGWGAQTLVTSAPGAQVDGAPQGLTLAGQATRITEALPGGWGLSAVSCVDKNASSTGNPASVINPVISSGGIFDLPASVVRAGAALVCTVTNSYGGYGLSGQVILDNGLGSGGVAHDGVQNGSEPGHAGVVLKLTDCANQVFSSGTTDGNGQFTLSTNAAPAGSTVCLVESLPAGYVPVSRQLGNTAGSYNPATQTLSFTLAASTSYSGVLLGEVALSQLLGEGAQQVASGQSAVYAHTYTAGTSASVLFSTSDQSGTSTDKWSSLVYVDSNCNGRLDSGETPLSQAVNVQAGQQLCLLVKVNSPAGQPNGTRDQTTLLAQETYQPTPGLGATVKTYSRVDVSTIGTSTGGTLSLLKQVRVVSACPSTASDTQLFSTSNQAQPGQFVEYQLLYSNRSTGPLTAIRISDSVPAYTLYRSGGCGPVSGGLQSCALTQQPASGGSGSLQWDLVDAPATAAQSGLQPGATGWVQFCVQIQQ